MVWSKQHTIKQGILIMMSTTFLFIFATSSYGNDRTRYDSCITGLSENAKTSEKQARLWQDEGGGPPATHCLALALFEQKKFSSAALELERLAAQLTRKGPVDQADVWAQAANAWLLGDAPGKADAAINEALKKHPNDADFLLDRARIRAELKDYRGSLSDLDKINQLGFNSALIQSFRAAALRNLTRYEEAMTAANGALEQDGSHSGALLERALIHLAENQIQKAVLDFREILDLPGEDAAKSTAEKYLKALTKAATK